jgi:hypothetical protein
MGGRVGQATGERVAAPAPVAASFLRCREGGAGYWCVLADRSWSHGQDCPAPAAGRSSPSSPVAASTCPTRPGSASARARTRGPIGMGGAGRAERGMFRRSPTAWAKSHRRLTEWPTFRRSRLVPVAMLPGDVRAAIAWMGSVATLPASRVVSRAAPMAVRARVWLSWPARTRGTIVPSLLQPAVAWMAAATARAVAAVIKSVPSVPLAGAPKRSNTRQAPAMTRARVSRAAAAVAAVRPAWAALAPRGARPTGTVRRDFSATGVPARSSAAWAPSVRPDASAARATVWTASAAGRPASRPATVAAWRPRGAPAARCPGPRIQAATAPPSRRPPAAGSVGATATGAACSTRPTHRALLPVAVDRSRRRSRAVMARGPA